MDTESPGMSLGFSVNTSKGGFLLCILLGREPTLPTSLSLLVLQSGVSRGGVLSQGSSFPQWPVQ